VATANVRAFLIESSQLHGFCRATCRSTTSRKARTLGAICRALGNLFNAISTLQSYDGHCGCRPPPPPPCPPQYPPQPPPLQQGKMWDVFFDAKTGTKTQQYSPIVLDLNGNGKADITGSNIKGNGKLEGATVKGFDLNPEARPAAAATRSDAFNAQSRPAVALNPTGAPGPAAPAQAPRAEEPKQKQGLQTLIKLGNTRG
jgi:hypothetical protein